MSAVTWAKNCRCSSTVRVSHSMLCWGHSPRLLLTPSMSSLMSWPLIKAVPLVGGMKPVGSVRFEKRYMGSVRYSKRYVVSVRYSMRYVVSVRYSMRYVVSVRYSMRYVGSVRYRMRYVGSVI